MASFLERQEGESLSEYKERVAYGRALADLEAATTVEDLRAILIGWVKADAIRFGHTQFGPVPHWKR